MPALYSGIRVYYCVCIMYKNMTMTRGITRNRVTFVLTAHWGIVSFLYTYSVMI